MSSSGVAAPVEGYTNILENAVQPVDLRKFQQVFGAAEYVAFEVLISYFARYLFKVEKRTLMELIAIHTVSIPLLGGLSAFVNNNSGFGYEAPFADLAADGAKGIPAVFASQYICNTALQGLHAPRLNFQDILVTSAAKLVTRPIVSFLYPMLGDTFRSNLDIIDEVINRQHSASRLKMNE